MMDAQRSSSFRTTRVCERRQETHTDSVLPFRPSCVQKSPEGLTNESEVSSRGKQTYQC